MKKFLVITAIIFSTAANAQITKVVLQASGLTCSMCSNSINKSLRSLDFVEKVEANLKASTFDISFKPNKKVDFEKLKKKVEDAGFFVAGFSAVMHFNNVKVKSNEVIAVGDKTLRFVNVKEQILNGAKPIRIIDKGYVSSKEYKNNSVASAVSKNGRIYNVTI